MYFFFPQYDRHHESPSKRRGTESAGRYCSANHDRTCENSILVNFVPQIPQRKAENRDVAITNTEEQADPEIDSADGQIHGYSAMHSETSLSGHLLYRHLTFIILINLYVLGTFVSIPLNSALENRKVSDLLMNSLPIVMEKDVVFERKK